MENIEEELISEAEAAEMLRQRPRTLTTWRCAGKGPKYLKIGRSVFYQKSVIREFIAASVVA